jgi:hypothetical protein
LPGSALTQNQVGVGIKLWGGVNWASQWTFIGLCEREGWGKLACQARVAAGFWPTANKSREIMFLFSNVFHKKLSNSNSNQI